jgi:hypothetical protein
MLEAVHLTPALRMQDSHNSSAMGGLLPRASIYELGKRNVKGGHGYLQSDYLFFLAPVSALLCVWRCWCSSVLLAPWYTILPWRIDAGACVLNWLPPSSQPVCISWRALCNMPRKRGTPRRGSAWYARKEQRQRREQLERALVMATSLLRKKVRAEEKALLSTIAEKEIGRSSMDTVMLEGSTEQLYPACIVEEDPTLEDLTPMEAPCDIGQSGSGECKLNLGLDADPPGCIVEEVPWPDLEDVFDAGRATGKAGWQDDVKRRSPTTKVVTCMAFSSVRSTCPWCLSSEATCLTWSIVPSSWASDWTCFSMPTLALQLGESVPSVRSLSPSRPAPRGCQMQATGHQLPRFFMILWLFSFMLMFYVFLDFRHLSWFPPGRTGATSLQLF